MAHFVFDVIHECGFLESCQASSNPAEFGVDAFSVRPLLEQIKDTLRENHRRECGQRCKDRVPAQHLARLRWDAALTRDQVAGRAGISTTALTGYEQGELKPDRRELARLERVIEDLRGEMDAELAVAAHP